MEVKPAKTFEEQLDILRSRGLEVENELEALEALQRINYYRLSAYTLPFKGGDKDAFIEGTSFRSIIRLYDFDHRLRYLLSEVLESVEIAFRDRVAYVLGHAFGALGYQDALNFRSVSFHAQFMVDLQKAVEKSHELFIPHHQQNYSGKFPIWVAIEVLSFGTVSLLYKNMKSEQQAEVSAYYDVGEPYLSTWVHSSVRLRNTCAHYGRLYSRGFSPIAKFYSWQRKGGIDPYSLFANLMALRGLCPTPRERTNVINNIRAIIEEYDAILELKRMGFPNDWDSRLLDIPLPHR